MTSDYRIFLYLILGGAAVVYGVFLFPPITPRGASGPSNVDAVEFNAAVSREMAFCRAQTDDINCGCFANLSGTILTSDNPRVPGAFYADQKELARGQAERSC